MKNERLYLIDLFKLTVLFCISIYHGYSLIYFNTCDAAYYAHTFYMHALSFARIFATGGLIIVAISFVLLGYVDLSRKKIERIFAFIILGTVLLMISQVDNPFKGLFWDWDIYQYLAASILSLIFLYRRPRLLMIAAFIGFVMSWISFYPLANDARFPLLLRAVCFGVCDKEGRGGWAIFPWIGLPWMSFYFGKLIREHRAYALRLPWLEVILWVPLLVLGVFTWGAYYDAPNDYNFYCFIFRKPPYVFWGHFVWFFFILRLAFVREVNQFLGNFSFVRWLASLRLTTNFGLCYLMQLLYLYLFTFFDDYMHAHLLVYDFFIISILPASEWMGRIALRALKKSEKLHV